MATGTTTKGLEKSTDEKLVYSYYRTEKVMVQKLDTDGKPVVDADGKPEMVVNQVPKKNDKGEFVDASGNVVEKAEDAAKVDDERTVEAVEIFRTDNPALPLKQVHRLASGTLNGAAITSQIKPIDILEDMKSHYMADSSKLKTLEDFRVAQKAAEAQMNNTARNSIQRAAYAGLLKDLPSIAATHKKALEDKAAPTDATQVDKDASTKFNAGYDALKTELDASAAQAEKVIASIKASEAVKATSMKPMSGIPTTNDGREVQALLKLAGFDPEWIDGQVGGKTRAAYEAFAAAYDLPLTTKPHEMHHAIMQHYNTNADFRSTVRDRAAEVVASGKDRESVKAAQVLMNMELRTDLAIDGVAGQNTKDTVEKLKEIKDPEIVGSAEVEKLEGEFEALQGKLEETKSQLADKDAKLTILTKAYNSKSKEIGETKKYDTLAARLLTAEIGEIKGKDSDNVAHIAAAFNALTPELLEGKKLKNTKDIRQMYEETKDFYEAGSKEFANFINDRKVGVGDVVILKEGNKAVFLSKVDEYGQMFYQDGQGKELQVTAVDIKGIGDSSEMMERKSLTIAPTM